VTIKLNIKQHNAHEIELELQLIDPSKIVITKFNELD